MIKEFNEENIQLFMSEWLTATLDVAKKHNLSIADPGISFDSQKLDIQLNVSIPGGVNKSTPKEREIITSKTGHVCEIIPFPVS